MGFEGVTIPYEGSNHAHRTWPFLNGRKIRKAYIYIYRTTDSVPNLIITHPKQGAITVVAAALHVTASTVSRVTIACGDLSPNSKHRSSKHLKTGALWKRLWFQSPVLFVRAEVVMRLLTIVSDRSNHGPFKDLDGSDSHHVSILT